jgi:type II secretory pathway component PulF
VATGPAEPFASDQTHWEEDVPAPEPVPVKESGDLEGLDNESYAPQPGRAPMRLRHLMYLIAAMAVVFWLVLLAIDARLIGSLVVLVGLAFTFAAVLGGAVILARARATRQDSLLSVLAIAAERGMPLAPAILAFADQYRGFSYRRITNLAVQINWGVSLPEALERSRKLVSRDAIVLTWVGQVSGTLPRALRMATYMRLHQLPIWTAISARLSYILGLLLAMQMITGFIMYFVIPKFEAIFKDFGVSLPQVTILVIEMSHFFIRYFFITTWIPLIEIGLLIFLPLSFLSWSNYTIPLFDRLLGRRHTALLLRSLALAVEGGKPISLGLSTLSQHYPTAWVRRRLLSVEKEVEQGADWIEALRHYRLIRSTDADVLKSAAEVGNLSWALLELAETAERRLAIRFQMVIQTLFPLVVVMLGASVFVMAMAYFVPLVSLISELTRQ